MGTFGVNVWGGGWLDPLKSTYVGASVNLCE